MKKNTWKTVLTVVVLLALAAEGLPLGLGLGLIPGLDLLGLGPGLVQGGVDLVAKAGEDEFRHA